MENVGGLGEPVTRCITNKDQGFKEAIGKTDLLMINLTMKGKLFLDLI